jgi:hypothetical protein
MGRAAEVGVTGRRFAGGLPSVLPLLDVGVVTLLFKFATVRAADVDGGA